MADAAKREVAEYTGSIIREAQGDEKTGMVWDVVLIGPGRQGGVVRMNGREYIPSANGRLYSCDALRRSVEEGMWEGVKIYDNHLTDQEYQQRQGMRSVKDEWMGTCENVRWVPKQRQIRGVLRLVDPSFGSKLKTAYEQGVLGSVGLSIDTYPEMREAWVNGKQVTVIEGFAKIVSVDVVSEPAAGGGFGRLIASVLPDAQNKEGETTMSKDLETLFARFVEQMLDDEEEELEIEAEDELEDEPMEEELVEEPLDEEPLDEEPLEAEDMDDEEEEFVDEAEDFEDEGDEELESLMLDGLVDIAERLEAMENERLIKKYIVSSRLPKALRDLATATLPKGQLQEAQVKRHVNRIRKAYAAIDPTGRVTESGAGRGFGSISMGMTERDKQEVEFLRLLAGNYELARLEQNDAHFVQERLQETAHADWVKAGRPRYGTRRLSDWVYEVLGGDPLADNRAYEAITTSGMSSIVKNALNVMLAASYSQRHRWWEPLVRTEEVDTIDDATLVRTYGMNTLAVVAEGDPYAELSWSDEEETATFAKRGNYAGITIETLLRDKLNEVRRIPDRLANSWYNTISTLVSNVFTVNSATGPVLGTTGALFNATAATSAGGHANLLTTALSVSAYDAAFIAMQKQTDQSLGAGQRLLIEPKYLLVPADLVATATQIRNSELIPGNANNDVNPYFQRFEIVTVPHWTDTNNWALVADPALYPAIWLIFLRGRTVPELFTADSEVVGSMFTNDTLRYKVRMMTWRFSSTYDCAPVSDFRPLHKNNV